MDFIDVSDNNVSSHPQQTNAFCPTCGGKMLFVTKGSLAENYVCESCGTTINPEVEYLSHNSEITDMFEDENNLDSLSIVQKQDPPKNQGPDDWVDRDIKMEIERGGRKQVVSISTNKSSEAFTMKGSGINRIERPKRN